jgi:hypothetical protein
MLGKHDDENMNLKFTARSQELFLDDWTLFDVRWFNLSTRKLWSIVDSGGN